MGMGWTADRIALVIVQIAMILVLLRLVFTLRASRKRMSKLADDLDAGNRRHPEPPGPMPAIKPPPPPPCLYSQRVRIASQVVAWLAPVSAEVDADSIVNVIAAMQALGYLRYPASR